MKVFIDTKNKIIKLEDPTNLGEFFDFLEEVFPNVTERRSYTLEISFKILNKPPNLPSLPYNNPYKPYNREVTFSTIHNSVDEAYEK